MATFRSIHHSWKTCTATLLQRLLSRQEPASLDVSVILLIVVHSELVVGHAEQPSRIVLTHLS